MNDDVKTGVIEDAKDTKKQDTTKGVPVTVKCRAHSDCPGKTAMMRKLPSGRTQYICDTCHRPFSLPNLGSTF